MKFIVSFIALVLFCDWGYGQEVPPRRLGRYNIDRRQISVSGISSGASFAHMFHVIHSATIMGASVMAANMPYNCAENHDPIDCGLAPENVDVNELIGDTERFASQGDIDHVANLRGSMVLIFHGTEDWIVDSGTSRHTEAYYRHFGANLTTEFSIPVGHGQPTLNYGLECDESFLPSINNCSYDGAYKALSTIYTNLQPRHNGSLQGELFEFDQQEFKESEDDALDDVGYIYVPQRCANTNTTCRLHLYFHACANGRLFLDDEVPSNIGYNEVAETNDIIVVYPQNEGELITCWDTSGYEGNGLGWQTKQGIQVQAIKRMVDRVAGN